MPDILEDYLRDLIEQIPPGKVTTFKILASFLGSEYAIRYVYEKYRKFENWYRIVREDGLINDNLQISLLKKEGVEIEKNKIKNLDKYLFTDFKVKTKILERFRKTQEILSKKIVLEDKINEKDIEKIGGIDISYKNDIAYVVIVILDKNLKLVEKYFFKENIIFPYISTFLSFREGIVAIKSLRKINLPDILFVNGSGICHPVKMGLASYIGVILNIPTIGITKSHLYGKIRDNKILDHENNLIGYVLEKFGTKIYVSPGNLISLESSFRLSDMYWIKGKYPEPIRIADELSKKIKSTL